MLEKSKASPSSRSFFCLAFASLVCGCLLIDPGKEVMSACWEVKKCSNPV